MIATWRHVEAWRGPSMGGQLLVDVSIPATNRAGVATESGADGATRRRGARVASHVEAWAGRLTRFDAASELSALNDAAMDVVPVGPTLAAVLDWARAADAMSGGVVDVTLLPERLAAESGGAAATAVSDRSWSLVRRPRGAVVVRSAGVTFDLDGVAKGWLADRALALLADVPGAIVDADGDIAIRLAPDDVLILGVADPRHPAEPLAFLRVAAPAARRDTVGVATSGVSVHRWTSASAPARHHLIDPRTRRPAETDLVQATVVARSAREAETLAKTAVILGRDLGLAFLDAAAPFAAIVLTDTGECLATRASLDWLVMD